MRRFFVLASVGVSLSSSFALAQNKLMPLPAELSKGPGSLALKSTFKVSTPGTHDERLEQAIARAVRRVEMVADLRHEGVGYKDVPSVGEVSLVVNVAAPGQVVQGITEDESYSLAVTSDGVKLDAKTDVGAMHGLETLIQLVQPGANGYEIPAVMVNDSPRFAWRGLMIDCVRHFEPLPVLKRNIDAMAAVKMNVFHWHLTDDQGWRLESKVYPRLTGVGSDGLFYTQADVKEIVAYARARGIRVVPEIEMPGHSVAWLLAYPELGSGTKATGIRREFGISKTAIDPTNEQTYAFLRKLLTEVTALFPDKYVHIGGDETPAPDWKENARIVKFKEAHKLKDNEELQAYFNQRVLKILTGLNKRMMGWDEILSPTLPKDIVIQSWRGVASLGKGAQMGYEGILSAPYYLDAMKSAGEIYPADPVPADSKLTDEEKKRVLGGEATMWAEQLNESDIDSRIWPRAAAVAERFWSAQSVTNVDDMYARLEQVSLELEQVGLQHLKSGDERLRAMAHSEHIDALRMVASAMEPVSFSDRSRTQHTDQLTPLDRFVDAVRPDPWTKHWNDVVVARCLQKDAAACEALSAWYAQVDSAIPAARRQMAASPQMKDVLPRLEQMHVLLDLGQKAALAVSKGNSMKANAAQRAALEDGKKPVALVRFTFVGALAKLIEAGSVEDAMVR